jgi:phosphate transport system permease protein
MSIRVQMPANSGDAARANGEIAVTDAVITASLRQARLAERERRKVLRRLRLSDRGFHLVTQLSAAAVLVILGGVILSLVLGSLPAIQKFGFSFLASQS